MLLKLRIPRPVLFIVFIVFAVLALLSLALLTRHAGDPIDPFSSFVTPYINRPNPLRPTYCNAVDPQRANATFVMLARNSDIDGAVHAVRSMEDRFNRNYNYPWVFLNEEPFADDFKRRISIIASGPVYFGQVPGEHWYQPSWINETKAEEERDRMQAENIIYGGSLPYRNMCRFNAGFFYRHPLLQGFRYYWRVEPNVRFHCDINIDPFVFMHENNKTYGFTIAIYEFRRTIESLWSTVRAFISEYPEHVMWNSAMGFLSDNGGTDYNLCHFWSNFEIADLDFWRGEAYTAFFEYLDSHGGFYYERWGDAPVHSIAAALFAGKDRIHFFHEIGYEHPPYTHCPADEDVWERGRCTCDPAQNFDYDGYSCMRQWDKMVNQVS